MRSAIIREKCDKCGNDTFYLERHANQDIIFLFCSKCGELFDMSGGVTSLYEQINEGKIIVRDERTNEGTGRI